MLSRTFYGAILGVAVMMTFISLQTAIFWGQYSGCESSSSSSSYITTLSPTAAPSIASTLTTLAVEYDVKDVLDMGMGMDMDMDMVTGRRLYGVDCEHTRAMSSACFFSVLMFMSYLVLIGVLIKHKNGILGSSQLNERYTAVPSSEGGFSSNSSHGGSQHSR